MAMIIDNKFEIGDTVYLKTDQEQLPRILMCIRVNKYDLLYEVITTTTTSCHYDFEISAEKNILINA